MKVKLAVWRVVEGSVMMMMMMVVVVVVL